MTRFTSLFALVQAAAALPAYLENGASTVGPFDPRRILCPVLAAMINAGDLHPDEAGDLTLEDIYQGLNDKLWDGPNNADVQATGIADYNIDNKVSEKIRDRCFSGTPCWLAKQIHGGVTNETERWLGVYRMNGRMMAEHGASTGTRGGATNVPEFDYTGGPCNGEYPCEERFQKFYVPCADKNGNFFIDNIMCVACNAWTHGDRGGEFSYNPTQTFQQWQHVAAFTGWIRAFGRVNGTDDYGPNTTHFTMADVRAMVMEGRYPDGWTRRHWGSVQDFYDAASFKLPCADKYGYNPVWWEGHECESFSGSTCSLTNPCHGGADCLTGYWTGKCVCGRGKNNIGMCWKNGQCVERESKCTYFGEKCVTYVANNPDAPN